MENAFLLRMRSLARLGETDRERILHLCQRHDWTSAGTDIVSQGDYNDNVRVVLSGFACRYKILPDGSRQIVAFLVPGDICDMHVALLGAMDHSIAAMSETSTTSISRADIDEIVSQRPDLARAMRIADLIEVAVLRELLVNNGRRESMARISHLLWELYLRHAAVDRVFDHQFELPLTQKDIADATSLSHVHVSRTVSKLKARQILQWTSRTVRFTDPPALLAVAQFDPDYLHSRADEVRTSGSRAE